MNRPTITVVSLLLLAGCTRPVDRPVPGLDPGQSLTQARQGFRSKVLRRAGEKEPVPEPPAGVFQKVGYQSPAGYFSAYVTPDPGDGKKHPAIVWVTGGDCNSIGDVWSPAPPDDDQTAAAYRQAGLVMAFPSLRGGNDNPGFREGFLGEVNDVIACAKAVERLPYVDPTRIYLGGHSTGGTLVLLVAETTDRFRAVFSFGPVDDVGGYPDEYLPFDTSDPKEVALRSPGRWVHSLKCPTFVFEGWDLPGNTDALRHYQRAQASNPLLHAFRVKGANHFSLLAPTNRLIASRVLEDTGATVNLNFTEQELAQ